MSEIDKATTVRMCRALGVHVKATPQELKTAYKERAKLYHPDKHPNATKEALQINEDRFKIIQEAYEYLTKNHDAIQAAFSHLENFSLISRGSSRNLAHWVYTSVQEYG